MHSGPGEYHGFFWFYFINEHLLRFLNLRYPRDYNTVPRALFWLFHLLWLFPWQRLSCRRRRSFRTRRVDRAGRIRLLACRWIGLRDAVLHLLDYAGVLLDAVLSGAGAADRFGHGEGKPFRASSRLLLGASACSLRGCVRYFSLGPAPPGQGRNCAGAVQNPEMYTLSLGHMEDLTLAAFAFLKLRWPWRPWPLASYRGPVVSRRSVG